MDSSESLVYREQGGIAYSSYFKSFCYYPVFSFNQFGDCGGVVLCPSNIHSAGG
ncbi:hypothetical protein ACFLWO_03850 [Chloroflexota bacterium]